MKCLTVYSDGPLFAFSLFTPSIINELGYQATAANLLSVPVYAWACIMTVVVGFWGDRVKTRAWINLYVHVASIRSETDGMMHRRGLFGSGETAMFQ